VLFWHWLIIGAALVGLELLTPGVFLIWLGAAGFITAAVQAILPELS
jgi:membrane protein implicated in regulation of membrane protease activity